MGRVLDDLKVYAFIFYASQKVLVLNFVVFRAELPGTTVAE